jgi:hypothetical protein
MDCRPAWIGQDAIASVKEFRSLDHQGSSAFTWQEAAAFANKNPVGKSTV